MPVDGCAMCVHTFIKGFRTLEFSRLIWSNYSSTHKTNANQSESPASARNGGNKMFSTC
jgi:hypothetical protein